MTTIRSRTTGAALVTAAALVASITLTSSGRAQSPSATHATTTTDTTDAVASTHTIAREPRPPATDVSAVGIEPVDPVWFCTGPIPGASDRFVVCGPILPLVHTNWSCSGRAPDDEHGRSRYETCVPLGSVAGPTIPIDCEVGAPRIDEHC